MQAFTNAKAQVKKISTDNNDTSTYTATVNIFDAKVTKKPGVLYLKIHIKNCSDNLVVSQFEFIFSLGKNP